jgi:hypothetical protein
LIICSWKVEPDPIHCHTSLYADKCSHRTRQTAPRAVPTSSTGSPIAYRNPSEQNPHVSAETQDERSPPQVLGTGADSTRCQASSSSGQRHASVQSAKNIARSSTGDRSSRLQAHEVGSVRLSGTSHLTILLIFSQ